MERPCISARAPSASTSDAWRPRATPAGELELTWYAAPGWTRPPDPLPLVAFDAPCALRSRALETLSEAGVAAVVGAEADQLAGVRAAISAGRGVALMATHGQTPSGVESRDDAEVG